MKDVEESLEDGTKKLKIIGSQLNATYDSDLEKKMETFNDVLTRLMSSIDEFNQICKEANTGNLLTEEYQKLKLPHFQYI